MSEAGPSLLCVDDDPSFLRLVGRKLGRIGWSVTTAESLDEALSSLAEQQFDVVTLDHHLPDAAGLDLLRHHSETGAPPIVYMTGSQDARVAVEALKAGAADYIIKDIDSGFFDLLDNTLHKAIDSARVEREKRQAEEKLYEALAQAEQLLAQKSVLLRELDHRVGNSLQMVSSILALQARKAAPEVAKALHDANDRIRAVAGAHRYISYEGSTGDVDLSLYLDQLLTGVWNSIAPAELRHLKKNMEPVIVPSNQAVSVGIIATELVLNACKHAYRDDEPGDISVALSRDEENFRLVVGDGGKGPPPRDEGDARGLGSLLIETLARTHSGELRHQSDADGHRAILTIPFLE